MIDETTAVALVVGMALVTYLSRIGGVWAMSFVRMSPRMEAALKALSGSVLVALVVPAAIRGGPEFLAAVGSAASLTALTGRPLAAMVGGLIAAASVRALL